MLGRRDDGKGSGRDTGETVGTAAERRAAQKREEYSRKRRLLRIGQVLMALGVVVGVVHWLGHLGAFGGGQPSALADLVAGYPAAGLLVVAGAIAAGQ